MMVIIGIDLHRRSHTAGALDVPAKLSACGRCRRWQIAAARQKTLVRIHEQMGADGGVATPVTNETTSRGVGVLLLRG